MNRVLKYITLILLVISLVSVYATRLRVFGGLAVGAAWVIINFLLYISIFQIAIVEKNIKKVPVLLVIKFPILYMFGFIIVASRVFPFYSILTGAAFAVLMGVGIKLWPNLACLRQNYRI